MDTMPDSEPMEIPRNNPLGGLDPADLLKQGIAEDTLAGDASPPFTPPPLEELAAIFPQFEILELIGQGGMGAVYKVRQKDLDRIVALKILPPSIGRSPEFSNRFTREARALAKLNHPGIVTIHDFGQTSSSPLATIDSQPLYYILMEFVDGVNLAQLMKTGRISPREALAIVPQICDALQYAHDQGIVHRDIKPENILLDRLGRVKVADFGIAKVLASVCDPIRSGDTLAPENQTLAGKIIGTPAYMAPEQIDRPSEVDHRADIYALGVVFYQMLTGELPDKRLEAPSKKVHIDVRLDEIVLQAMENNPELRFQQASVMRTRIDGLGGAALVDHKAESLSAIEKVKDDLFMPAVGLGIVGAIFLGLAGAGILMGVLSRTIWQGANEFGLVGWIQMVQAIIPLVVGLVLFLSSRSMRRLRGYGISVAGCIVSLFTVIGTPFGIWGLIILTKREVKEAFGGMTNGVASEASATKMRERDRERPQIEPGVPPAKSRSTGEMIAIGCGVAGLVGVLLMVALGTVSWLFSMKNHEAIGRQLQSAKQAEETIRATTSPSKTFGPAVERLMKLGDNDGPIQWLNLDSGVLAEKPRGWWLTQAMDPKERNTLPGLGFSMTDTGFDVTSIGMAILTIAANEKWDSATPGSVEEEVERLASEDLMKSHSPLSDSTVMAGNAEMPKTYFFKTPKRTVGILQITAFTENPRGVKIRYKLVQSAGSIPPAADKSDRIAVEDLALHLIVAIREKNDDKLRALASDRIKGWPDALPQFAVELREHYRQSTGNEAFDLRASESLVDGKLAVVRCTGPAELKGKCLALYFVKTDDGWRNHSLRATTQDVPLPELMEGLKKQIRQVGDAATSNKEARKIAEEKAPTAGVPARENPSGRNPATAARVTGTLVLPKDFPEVQQAAVAKAALDLLASCSFSAGSSESDMFQAKNGVAHIQITFPVAMGGIHPDEMLITFPLTSGSVWTRRGNQYERHAKFTPAAAAALSTALGHAPSAAFSEAAGLPEKDALAPAKTWVAGIDAGNYVQSWKDAAVFFQQSITESAWTEALTKVRKPMGEVKSRKLLAAQSVKSLPGAPDGEYVVMQFDTSFAAKEKAVETVTFMKESDGSWKAAGYFIR